MTADTLTELRPPSPAAASAGAGLGLLLGREEGWRVDVLPPQPTPLIGRDRELAEVRDRLLRADVRLLTLIRLDPVTLAGGRPAHGRRVLELVVRYS